MECAGCFDPVHEIYLIVEEQPWHRYCLVCTKCRKPLIDGAKLKYTVKGDSLYCPECLQVCAECNRQILSKPTFAAGKIWHSYHFTCHMCKAVLDKFYIEHANYVLCEYCDAEHFDDDEADDDEDMGIKRSVRHSKEEAERPRSSSKSNGSSRAPKSGTSAQSDPKEHPDGAEPTHNQIGWDSSSGTKTTATDNSIGESEIESDEIGYDDPDYEAAWAASYESVTSRSSQHSLSPEPAVEEINTFTIVSEETEDRNGQKDENGPNQRPNDKYPALSSFPPSFTPSTASASSSLTSSPSLTSSSSSFAPPPKKKTAREKHQSSMVIKVAIPMPPGVRSGTPTSPQSTTSPNPTSPPFHNAPSSPSFKTVAVSEEKRPRNKDEIRSREFNLNDIISHGGALNRPQLPPDSSTKWTPPNRDEIRSREINVWEVIGNGGALNKAQLPPESTSRWVAPNREESRPRENVDIWQVIGNGGALNRPQLPPESTSRWVAPNRDEPARPRENVDIWEVIGQGGALNRPQLPPTAPKPPTEQELAMEKAEAERRFRNEMVQNIVQSLLQLYDVMLADKESVKTKLKQRIKRNYQEAILTRQMNLHSMLMPEVNIGVQLRKVNTKEKGSPMRSKRHELCEGIRKFNKNRLRKTTPQKLTSTRAKLLASIRTRRKLSLKDGLRQVVGRNTAQELIPMYKNIIWIGRKCFGVTLRDIQYLLRDPVAVRDIAGRLSQRYRYISDKTIDVVVCVPHEVAIFFATRLAIALNTPLVVLHQRPLKGGSQAFARNYIPQGRTRPVQLFAATVEAPLVKKPDVELWTTADRIRAGDRAIIIDDILDNAADISAAMLVIHTAGALVVEVACIMELMGFDGRENLDKTMTKICIEPRPLVHSYITFDDNANVVWG